MITVLIILNIVLLGLVVYFLFIKERSFPKWEYYKKGIRFYNKENEVTIEYDKPLRK